MMSPKLSPAAANVSWHTNCGLTLGFFTTGVEELLLFLLSSGESGSGEGVVPTPSTKEEGWSPSRICCSWERPSAAAMVADDNERE